MIVQDEISLTKVKNGVDGGDGKDGTNGKDGKNGKDSNTHTAYSWSADGSDRFTTVYPNENLSVGVSLPNMKEISMTTAQYYVQEPTGIKVKAGVNYVYSIEGYSKEGSAVQTNLGLGKASGGFGFDITPIQLLTKNRIQRTFVVTQAQIDQYGDFLTYRIRNGQKAMNVVYGKVKIEEGTSATIYTSSPKDDFNNAWPTFIGTYSSHDKVQSQNPKDYTWARMLGESGKDGENGKDGQTPKDVINGYLSNEAIIVPATPTGNVTDYSKAFGDFIVFEGQDKKNSGVTYSKVSEVNMTSTINSAGRYVVTDLSADTGTATYRASYAGVTVDKILIVVKNKQGPSGANGANGKDGSKGDKGDKGATGNTGPKGDPTGITTSATVPSNPYINMLWQNTGSNNGYLTGTVYQWNGAKWNIFIFTAENIVASTLSALTAYLGDVKGGTITGAKFINEGEFYNPAIDKMCLFESEIKGPISTNYSEKGGRGKGAFYLSPPQIGGRYSKNGNIERPDDSWSLGGSGVWLESGSQSSGNWSYTNLKLNELRMHEERFNNTQGEFNLKISDIAKYTPTQLDAASGYSIYSLTEENLPTAKRNGRTVTLSGAFTNKNNVSTSDSEILLGYLPKWAAPKDIERVVAQGSGMNRFLLTVRPNGNIYWSRYGSSSSYGTAGAGAWLNISIRYDGADL